MSELDACARAQIACPGCGFVPSVGQQWVCAPDGCGASFDTFETHAHCPSCDAQFPWTQCPACGGISPHERWYRRSASS